MVDETQGASLTLNRSTGRYEGVVKVEVEAEFVRRRMLQAVAEDETADLTDPKTWQQAAARVGSVMWWLDKPNVRVTPYTAPPAPKERVVTWTAPPVDKPLTKAQQLEARLRECATKTPPHLWEDQCRTPIAPLTLPAVERENVGRLRYEEKVVLRKLYGEWEAGTFVLDETAEEQEHRFREQSDEEIQERLGLVAEAVNGMRLR